MGINLHPLVLDCCGQCLKASSIAVRYPKSSFSVHQSLLLIAGKREIALSFRTSGIKMQKCISSFVCTRVLRIEVGGGVEFTKHVQVTLK